MERTAVLQSSEGDPVAATPVRKAAVRLVIPARFLLSIYAILPLCLAAMFADRHLWGGTLLRSMPDSPEQVFFFQLIFGTPHIIGSAVILAGNTEYLRFYWLRIVLFTLGILVFFSIGNLYLPYEVMFGLVGAATVLHVIKQQVGVGRGMARASGPLYTVWGWTLVVFGSILYYAVYADEGFTPQTADRVNGVLAGLGTLALALTLACHTRIAGGLGRMYLWGNAVMVLQSGVFYWQGYPFLAILGPRLIHDLTAFTFYVAHDVNRHTEHPRGGLYRWAAKLGLGVWWVCPTTAVLLTYVLGKYLDPLTAWVGLDLPYSASFIFIGYLGLLHYYTEAFTWRKDSPYRAHFAIGA